MLELEGVRKTYIGDNGRISPLDGASLRVAPGEFVAVRGPSGCGKTTLLLVAGAMLAPDEGTVSLDGQDLYALDPEERARFRARKVGFVFQQFHLVPYLSVWDNVLAASLAAPTPDAEARARELLERFQLADRRGHVPARLSTGERQRAALARALLNRPRLLLADEPTGNLDPENSETVLAAFAEFTRGGGCLLLVTHSPGAASRADRVLAFQDGRLESSA